MSAAAGMCVTALGEGATNPLINKYKNTGILAHEMGHILSTCTLDNYGESNGERCGSCCFEDLDDSANICALVLSNCATGEILDWQLPPMGLTCPDDKICLDLECWKLPGQKCEPRADQVDLACMDPCELWRQLKQARLLMLAEKCQISWRIGNKSGAWRPQNYQDLLCAETDAREECQNCGGGYKTLQDIPGCY